MNKKAVILLIAFIVSFFVSLFLNFEKIDVPHFGAFYKKVQVDVIFKNSPPKIFFDDNEVKKYFKIDENHYLFGVKENKLIKKITIEDLQNVEKSMVYIGNEVEFLNSNQNEIEIENNKNFLDKFTISILSFFYNPQFYIVSYLFLFLFLYNFKFNFKSKTIFVFLLALGLVFRLTQINSIPFWDDEIYILTHTNTWLETLQDPGNPPLYFILFKIYRFVVQNPEFYKISSVIIGILFNICFYFYLKTILSKKHALIGLFIATFSIILIYLSQEIRCYMLLALLAVVNSYFLFKFKKKNAIFYFFSAIALLYTHYYAAFFVFYNFICGSILFFKNAKKIKIFLLMNVLIFLAYLPLFFLKAQNLTNDFNSWMETPHILAATRISENFSGNVLLFIVFLIICFAIYKKLQTKREKLFLNYSLYSIFFVFICAIAVSYLIKPIFCYRYFYVIFPNYLALVALILGHGYKTKFKNVLFILMFLCFVITSKLELQHLYCNHNLYIDFVKNDLDKTKNNYVFLSDTVIGYEGFYVSDANILYLPVNHGIKELDINQYDIKKPAVLYLLNLYLNDELLKTAKNIELYKTPLGVFCKVVL